ncbi:MAG: LamG domain-containing protein [Bacteroidota bacterium]|jgi:hypothetical protein
MKGISLTVMMMPTIIFLCVGVVRARQTESLGKDTAVVSQQRVVEWKLEDFNNPNAEGVTKAGDPHTVDSPYGKAVHFDGVKDGLFLNALPIEKLTQFTVEAFLQPDGKAPHEQRFLHMGEANGSRLLLETRVTDDDQWYLDAFIKSGDSSCTLIDKTKLHATGIWYHVALVVDNGKMDTYVNGKHELNGNVAFSPFKGGTTSVGVRMNRVSWFKGAIYKIRITPRCLVPSEFMKQ